MKYFLHIYKNASRILSEKQRKASKRGLWRYQNLSKEEKNKKRKKKALERYQNLSEEEKEKMRPYRRERHKNLSEEEKQRIVKRRINYYITHKK